MKKFYPYLALVIIGACSIIVFAGAFSHFFFEDDFFHIILTRSQSLWDAFNIFRPASRDYYIYRPLTTQLFWKSGEAIFGLNPLPFNIVNFSFFIVNIFLAYKLARIVTKSTIIGILAAFFYGLTGSNFYRLFFLSTFQETVGATLFLLTSIFYIRKSNWAFLTFVLALTAKETAITIPGVLFLYDLFVHKQFQKRIIVFGLMSIVYFQLHKFFFGFYTGGIYTYDFHPIKVLSNYFWYLLWSLGLPESFVNIRLYKAALLDPETLRAIGITGIWNLSIFALIPFVLIFPAVSWLNKRRYLSGVFLGGAIFFLTLLPVAFFPFHKFAINLASALFGVALVVAILVRSTAKWYWGVTISVFVVALSFSLNYNLGHHWTNRRGEMAQNVIEYLKFNYPEGLNGKTLYFRDNLEQSCDEDVVGYKNSAEISFAMAYEDGFKVFYPNDDFKVYYQAYDDNAHCNEDVETIDSRQLLP